VKEKTEKKLLKKKTKKKKVESARHKQETENLEKERLENLRLENEKQEKDRHEKERLEKERLENEKREHDRQEKERLEKEHLENEKREKQRQEDEKKRQERERLDKERLEKEKQERDKIRLEKEKKDEEERKIRIAKEKEEALAREEERKIRMAKEKEEHDKMLEQREKNKKEQELIIQAERKKRSEALEKLRESSKMTQQQLQQLEEELSKDREAKQTERLNRNHNINVFNESIVSYFQKLKRQVRQLNRTMLVPEVVVVGASGIGKSSLISAIIGLHLNLPSASTLKRCVNINIRNSDSNDWKISIKEGSQDYSQVKLEDLNQQVLLRKKDSFVTSPIEIKLEHKNVFDFNIIDAFGVDNYLIQLCKASQRIILHVQASQIKTQPLSAVIRNVDPHLKRTIFANTKLDILASKVTSGSLIDQIFGNETNINKNSFWSSFPEKTTSKSFVEDVYQSYVSSFNDCVENFGFGSNLS